MSIGDFARMTFLSVKALRHYHEVGLLRPAEIDQATGYRRYELAQVPTAQVIRRLRELDMSLDDVRTVIEAPDVRARNEAISAHLQRMEVDLEQTRATVQSLRLLLDEKSPPAIAVEYRAVGPSETLAIRDQVASADMFDWLEVALTELRAALAESGAHRSGADAALPELPEGLEVTPDLGGVDVRVVGDLLRRDPLLAHLLGLRQHLQVARQACGHADCEPLAARHGGPLFESL